MGANTSTPSNLAQFTAKDVADCVSAMGDKYRGYAKAILDCGVDGAHLATLTSETFEETLDCLQVTPRLHRRKLERTLARALQSSTGTSGAARGFTVRSSLSASSDDSSTSSIGFGSSLPSLNNSSSNLMGSLSSQNSHKSLLDGSFRNHDVPVSHPKVQKQPERKKRNHRKTPSQVPVEMVMETALAARQIDQLMPGSNSAHVPTVLAALAAAQASENENLQNSLLQLEHERTLDRPPEGKVAIVLTDIEGSTSLWEANPKAMKDALDIHDSLQRRLREKHFGFEIDTEGDAFFLAFSDAADALSFALDLQVALHETNWSQEILATPWGCDNGERRGLKVRVSIHMGPVTTLENPLTGRTLYHGEGLDIAQDLEEKFTRGGQILTTIDTWNAAFHRAHAKLGSPIVKEYSKTLVVDDYGSIDDSSSAGSGSGSASIKRIVELTPASMKPLTSATRRKTQQTQTKRSKLAEALRLFAKTCTSENKVVSIIPSASHRHNRAQPLSYSHRPTSLSVARDLSSVKAA